MAYTISPNRIRAQTQIEINPINPTVLLSGLGYIHPKTYRIITHITAVDNTTCGKYVFIAFQRLIDLLKNIAIELTEE